MTAILSHPHLLKQQYTASNDEKPELDALMANWPVPSDMTDNLHNLMYTHCAQPLPVYKNNEYVVPVNDNAALCDALVEVHFKIQHYHISRKQTDSQSANNLDSFNGHVKQIIVLKSAIPHPKSAYKRKNITEGPFRPKPFLTLVPMTASSAGEGTSHVMVISEAVITPRINTDQRQIPDDDGESGTAVDSVAKGKKIAPKGKSGRAQK